MANFNTLYDPILNTFDAFGWIPNVRGELSLDKFDNSETIMGDVDRFATEIKSYDGFNTSRYLAASSLFVFDDNKSGSHLRKTYRFFFRATINDNQRNTDFINNVFQTELHQDVEKLFAEKGKNILIGELSILAIPKYKLCDRQISLTESAALLNLQRFQAEKNRYDEAQRIDAVSLFDLEAQRSNLKALWNAVENSIIAVENSITDVENKKEIPIYKFIVLLSRDGLLFLKDDTCEKFRETYFQPNTASDYTQNIPIHRLFKIGLFFIKSLFHMNYHHSNEKDTFLPASNIHPINAGNGDLDRLVKHQIDTLFNPIINAKRNLYTNRNNIYNPDGLFPYAESLLYVFENNRFIDDTQAEIYHNHVKVQSKEYEVISSDRKIIRNSFLTQDNWITRITVCLAVLVAIMRTYNFLLNEDLLFNLDDSLRDIKIFMLRLSVFASSFVITWSIHKFIVHKNAYKDTFYRNKYFNHQSQRLLNIDSKKEMTRISFGYALRLFLINLRLQIGVIRVNYLKLFALIIVIPLALIMCRILIRLLIF